MSFKMDCPHCKKTLNVTEKAFGKTVPCPGCNQPIKVPHPAQMQRQASPLGAPPPWSGTAQNSNATPASARPLPAGMPPRAGGQPPAPPPKTFPETPTLPAGMPPMPPLPKTTGDSTAGGRPFGFLSSVSSTGTPTKAQAGASGVPRAVTMPEGGGGVFKSKTFLLIAGTAGGGIVLMLLGVLFALSGSGGGGDSPGRRDGGLGPTPPSWQGIGDSPSRRDTSPGDDAAAAGGCAGVALAAVQRCSPSLSGCSCRASPFSFGFAGCEGPRDVRRWLVIPRILHPFDRVNHLHFCQAPGESCSMSHVQEQTSSGQCRLPSLRALVKSSRFWLACVALTIVAMTVDLHRAPADQLGARLYLAGVHGYQVFLRPCTRGFVRCRYRPSCSEYSAQAVERYGLWKGLGLTICRLSRCTCSVPLGTSDPVPARGAATATMLRAGANGANPSFSLDYTEANHDCQRCFLVHSR